MTYAVEVNSVDGSLSIVLPKRLASNRLDKLIESSAKGEMIGDWHDYGRLLD